MTALIEARNVSIRPIAGREPAARAAVRTLPPDRVCHPATDRQTSRPSFVTALLRALSCMTV
jgi:hypothetical protein